ncbi:MAG: T9SS type A sorting domain-containing protein [Bacteroidaceae bacterium]|nr:T9SS type A sorting domain-containing protein [Bacteroidaceae bacterium]
MKKLALISTLALFAFEARAAETDWLNFATDPNGSVVESVLFRNHGRLTFGEAGMVYEADGERRSIPYSGGAYIFFSAEAPTGIADAAQESGLSFVYSRESRQIVLKGADAASRICLVSLEGAVLRVSDKSQAISTVGLPSGVLIATAVCGGKTVTKKFIIK